MHRPLLLLCCFALACAAAAQVTLDAGSVTPVPGDELTSGTGEFEQPGTGGAGQTWDHSAIVPSTTPPAIYIDPSATGVGGLFPEATVALDEGGGDFTFFRGSATGIEEDGFIISDHTGTCSDRLMLLQYPMTMGTAFTDDMYCTVTAPGGTMWSHDTHIEVEADGHGTLLLPWGTVQNVLRVHSQRHLVDYQYVPASIYDHERYSFYKPGTHGPLLTLFHATASIFGSTISDSLSIVIAQDEVGLHEALRNEIGVDLVPNPAHHLVEVMYGVPDGTAVHIAMVDVTGRVRLEIDRRTIQAGVQREVLDLGELSPGTYVVRVRDDDGAQGARRMVKQ